MNKFKKIYVIITVIIAVILGLLISVWNVSANPEYIAAFNGDKLSKQDYQELKEYADIYAKTLNSDFIVDKNIEIATEFNEKSTIITVNETGGGIIATYPSEMKSSSNEGEFILNIYYKNGEYEEYSNISNILFYISSIVGASIIFGALIFVILYYPTVIINWIIVSVKKIKNTEN